MKPVLILVCTTLTGLVGAHYVTSVSNSISLAPELHQAHHYRNILLFNRHATMSNNSECDLLLKKIYKHEPEFSSSTLVNYLLSNNQFEQAASAAERYRKMYGSGDWDVNLAFARALCALKKNDDAEKMFFEARSAAQRAWAREQIAYAQAVFYIQNNKLTQALTEIDHFLENNTPRSKHALFYFLKGTILLNNMYPDFEGALAQLDKGLELNPNFDRALKLKALVLEQQNKKPELVAVLKRVIELDPQPQLAKKLVSLYFELGQLDQAYNVLSELKETTPDSYYDLALLSWKLKNNTQALSHINQAIKLNTDFARARLLKLEILLSSDQKVEAMSTMKQWLTSDKEPKAYSMLGMLLATNTISPTDTIALLEEVAKNTKHHKETFSFLGDLYTVSENFKSAEISYKQFIKHLTKKDKHLGVKALYNLGFVSWRQGNVKQALADVSRAHELAPKNPQIANILAFLYTQQPDKQKVAKAKELLSLASTHAQATEVTAPLTQLLSEQSNMYTFSPFWSHFEALKRPAPEPTPDTSMTTNAQDDEKQLSPATVSQAA